MSTIHASSDTSGGTRFVAVLTMSGSANASARGSTRTVDPAVGAHFGIAGRLHAVHEASGEFGQVEVHPGGQGLHVAAGDQGTVVPEHHTAQDVQPRVGPHQRGPPLVLHRAADRGARYRNGIALGRDQVEVVPLPGAGDAGLHTAPEQHAVIGRLAAAAGIEGSTDPARSRPARWPARPHPTPAGSGRSAPADGYARLSRLSRSSGLADFSLGGRRSPGPGTCRVLATRTEPSAGSWPCSWRTATRGRRGRGETRRP